MWFICGISGNLRGSVSDCCGENLQQLVGGTMMTKLMESSSSNGGGALELSRVLLSGADTTFSRAP